MRTHHLTKPIAAAFALLLSASISHAATYTLRFYDTDDVMRGYITNSSHTNTLMLVTTYTPGGGDSGEVDISSFVTPGANDIYITHENTTSGYVYGFQFKIDGSLYDSGHCGIPDTAGCNGSLALGIVFTHHIDFVVPGGEVPIPATLPLFASGLGGLALLARRRKQKTPAAA